jgi:hypothetical protein
MKKHMFKGLALSLFLATTFSPLVYAQKAVPQDPSTQTAVPQDSTAQTVAPQEPPAQESATEAMGYGIGSALASVFYIPAKFTYASLGLITGGLGYALSGGSAEVANNIIYPAVQGNWVVTPNNLKGADPIYFVGAPPPAIEPRVEAAPETSTATR